MYIHELDRHAQYLFRQELFQFGSVFIVGKNADSRPVAFVVFLIVSINCQRWGSRIFNQFRALAQKHLAKFGIVQERAPFWVDPFSIDGPIVG